MTTNKRGFETLQDLVIKPGLCTRCGTCVGSCPTTVLEIDQDHLWPWLVPGQTCNLCGLCVSSCPQLGVPFDELNKQVFGQVPASDEPKGVVRGYWVGKAADPELWQRGAAGGIASALSIALLESGWVDGVFHCGKSVEQPWKTVPKLSRTREEVLGNAGSHYSTVPINALLKDLKPHGSERFALVGTGCHIQGLRKLQQAGAKGRRVVITVGLFCGENKSPLATLHLLEEMGITDPAEVISFTHRWPGGGGAQAILRNGERRRVGYNFGANMWRLAPFFTTLGCSICLDYYAELSDISIGDYRKGENVVLSRSRQGMQLIEEGIRHGRLDLRPIEWATDTVRRKTDDFIFQLKQRRACTLLADRKARGLSAPDFGMQEKSVEELWRADANRLLFLFIRRVMAASWARQLAKALPAPWQYWLGALFMGAELGCPWPLAGPEPIKKRIE